MNTIIGLIGLLVLVPLSLLVLYQWTLAVSSFLYRAEGIRYANQRARFLFLIPAHNEEAGIAATLKSIRHLDYPPEYYQVLVIADRCTDRTAAVVRSLNAACFQRHDGLPGKGAALAWGIRKACDAGMTFDAVVIVDADTLVDRSLLIAFNEGLQSGHHVQQGYNYISNPWESPFTRIIAVTGVLRNGRYYAGKTVLGLQGMLTGTGMCLSAKILGERGWTAFSVGEDWEFSVELLLAGESIHFNPRAKTFARESQGLSQASHQRLRWASGRYAVMGSQTWALLLQGVRRRSLSLIDAAITLAAPNYSTQASLSLLCLIGCFLIADDALWGYSFFWAAALFAAIGSYFLLGIFSTEAPGKALAGLALVPLFLPWRLTIELLGMIGYGRTKWGRRARAAVSSQPVNR